MPPATDNLSRLDALLAEVTDLRSTAALLNWDELVCMPEGGVPAHGDMLATVRRLAHEKFISDEVGRLIERATADLNGDSADSEAHKKVAVAARDYEKATRVPADFVAEHARASCAGHQAWREARAQSSFRLFEPHFSRLIELKQRYVEFYKPLAHPYDALLDDFEPGALTADVLAMFDVLRPRQVALIRAIRSAPPVDDHFLQSGFPEEDVLGFALEAVSAFGFDWKRGRQDKSAHPFATSMGSDDVRITTRYDAAHPFEMLFSMLHETGHGLYEQGISPSWNRTVVRGGASLGVHESQSRLWENIIGRSRPFWEHFYPRLQERFPSQLSGVTLDAFYRGINKVQPSLIRVEADEVTYNLHVMLRVEMEIGLLNGAIKASEAPDVWNSKMTDYLGITPTSADNGILQDMHWSVGLLGNFATYTIGNLISVQIWEKFKTAEPTADDQIRRGDFSSLRGWLQREIHQHGRSYTPAQLVERVTGTPIDPAPYLAYLDRKYRDIYGM
jgi:carboxypeptidase Taq